MPGPVQQVASKTTSCLASAPFFERTRTFYPAIKPYIGLTTSDHYLLVSLLYT